MPNVLEMRQEYAPQLFDSATGESLSAEKVLDISDVVENGERTLLLFTRAQRGRIVQITHPHADQVYIGAHIHYFIDEPLDGCLDYVKRRHGLSGAKFRRILAEHAPPKLVSCEQATPASTISKDMGVMKERPTDAEFEELKRKRDAAISEVVRTVCQQHGWDPEKASYHASNTDGCYCACPDGPCQHVWDGPEYRDDTMMSGTYSRCGAIHAFHDMRTMP